MYIYTSVYLSIYIDIVTQSAISDKGVMTQKRLLVQVTCPVFFRCWDWHALRLPSPHFVCLAGPCGMPSMHFGCLAGILAA